jgi:hypothetical protein
MPAAAVAVAVNAVPVDALLVREVVMVVGDGEMGEMGGAVVLVLVLALALALALVLVWAVVLLLLFAVLTVWALMGYEMMG